MKRRIPPEDEGIVLSPIDKFIYLRHPLVKWAEAMDWRSLENEFGYLYKDEPDSPQLRTRLPAGLSILAHAYSLSDEAACERWLENPYFQYFCGEEYFSYWPLIDGSSLRRWRQRMGEERVAAMQVHVAVLGSQPFDFQPKDLGRGSATLDVGS
jgi:IS5 family transposase